MLTKLKPWLTWPIVALLSALSLSLAAIAIWGPPEAQQLLFSADGLLFALVALIMRSPLPPPAPPPLPEAAEGDLGDEEDGS